MLRKLINTELDALAKIEKKTEISYNSLYKLTRRILFLSAWGYILYWYPISIITITINSLFLWVQIHFPSLFVLIGIALLFIKYAPSIENQTSLHKHPEKQDILIKHYENYKKGNIIAYEMFCQLRKMVKKKIKELLKSSKIW